MVKTFTTIQTFTLLCFIFKTYICLEFANINRATKYMLFFPGFMHNSNSYSGLLEKIEKKNIIVDSPDFTDMSFEKEFNNYKNYLPVVRENIKKQNIEPENVIFCGHSRGGLVASNLIHNTEFENLILFSPVDFNNKKLENDICVNKLLLYAFRKDWPIKIFRENEGFFCKNNGYTHFLQNINSENKLVFSYEKYGHKDITNSFFKIICNSNYNITELNYLTDKISNDIDYFF